MVKKVKWTKTAAKNFNRVIEYLQENWTDAVVQDFVIKTFSLLDFLKLHPEFGQIQVKEKGIRGALVTKQNKLFYRINRDEIIVLKIFDTRQKPSKLKFK